jgi:hypothetical protein
MPKTIEAIVEKDGRIRLLEKVSLPMPRRALVTILEDENEGEASETALLSEAALARDWNREEEDEAWRHLQEV